MLLVVVFGWFHKVRVGVSWEVHFLNYLQCVCPPSVKERGSEQSYKVACPLWFVSLMLIVLAEDILFQVMRMGRPSSGLTVSRESARRSGQQLSTVPSVITTGLPPETTPEPQSFKVQPGDLLKNHSNPLYVSDPLQLSQLLDVTNLLWLWLFDSQQPWDGSG